jgi:hypothetical protein
VFFWGVEGAYTQQGRAHIRRLPPDWAARPALMSRDAVESKAVVRIEVAVSPCPRGGQGRGKGLTDFYETLRKDHKLQVLSGGLFKKI